MSNIKMRPSRVLEKLRAGEVVSCFKINLSCPRVTDIAGISGFDCAWLDMEHVPNTWSVVESQIYAAKVHDVDSMVRVCRGSYSDYIKPLEMDAAGIMVPHIMSLADAKRVVRMTRFHPTGLRPVDGGNADGAYCNIDFPEYLRQANENRFVVLQIEDPEPLDELEEICSLEGIDIIFFGPGDFSHGIDAPGRWDHPEITACRKRVAEVAVAHGKFAGTVGTISDLEELVSLGYRFINVGADVIGLSQYCTKLTAEFSRKNR